VRWLLIGLLLVRLIHWLLTGLVDGLLPVRVLYCLRHLLILRQWRSATRIYSLSPLVRSRSTIWVLLLSIAGLLCPPGRHSGQDIASIGRCRRYCWLSLRIGR